MCTSSLHNDHHMRSDRRNELVYTSRFVRVICDSVLLRTSSGSSPLRRRTLLAVQAIGDPAFNSSGAARSHHNRCLICGGAARTRHEDAMPGKRLLPLHPRFCPLLPLAVLPARTARTSGSFPMPRGSKPSLALLWPFSMQGSRLAPAHAVRPAEDSALSAASVLSDRNAASFIAVVPFSTASFVDMLSRCYPPTSLIVFEKG